MVGKKRACVHAHVCVCVCACAGECACVCACVSACMHGPEACACIPPYACTLVLYLSHKSMLRVC